jgi:hypothetical protein
MIRFYDTKYTPSNFDRVSKKRLIFGHFECSETRGSSIINEIMHDKDLKKSRNKFKYLHMTEESQDRRLKKLSDIDVYIENARRDSQYPCMFGETALEACALGKIVITTLCSKNEPRDVRYELITANNEIELKSRIMWILSLTDFQIQALKKSARNWVLNTNVLYDPEYK